MTVSELRKKIAPLLPKGKAPLKRFLKDSLLLQLQEVNKKIAIFEGKYNKNFSEFKRDFNKMKSKERYSYEREGDFMDWEALELYKRDLMRVFHRFA